MKLVRVKRADGLKFVVTSSAYPSIKDKTYAVDKDGDEAKNMFVISNI